MDEQSKYSMVLTTVDSRETGEKLAFFILEKKLAACIQISEIKSYYPWEGEIQQEVEHLIRIKTRKSLYKSLEDCISENHPYETPQIIEVPITNGLDSFLGWIDQNTG
jgi:periplasmic divalent cation tolerance protein